MLAFELGELPLPEDIPDFDVVIVIRAKEEAAAVGECERLHTLEALLLLVLSNLPDGSQVIQLNGRVVTADR